MKRTFTDEERREEQLRREGLMFNNGVARFRERVEATKSRVNKIGNAVDVTNESATTYGKELMRSFIDDVIEGMAVELADLDKPGPGRKHIALSYMKQIPLEVLGYVTTKCILDSISRRSALRDVARYIGDRLEDQVRINRFKSENPKYFDAIMKDQKKKRVADYRRLKKVLVHSEGTTELAEWRNWPVRDKLYLGMQLIWVFQRTTGLIERHLGKKSRNRETAFIQPTELCSEWIRDNIEALEGLSPTFGPCVAPPIPWTSPTYGGFHTRELRKVSPMISTRVGPSELARMGTSEVVQQMGKVYRSVNALQNTGWTINDRVLDAMDYCFRMDINIGLPSPYPVEIPEFNAGMERTKYMETEEDGIFIVDPDDPRYRGAKFLMERDKQEFAQYKRECVSLYEAEQERRAQCFAFSRTLACAKQHRDLDRFHFVYQCDFRGRKYVVSSDLSPQGDDVNKGLLMFAKGVKLGPDGLRYMKRQLANVYGFDKADYEDREAWVSKHRDAIVALGSDPLSEQAREYWGWWKKADKPWQFLAVAMEYADIVVRNLDPYNYESHLGWAQDGSCNGIQHYSLILRDSVGGAAVNLIDGPVPSDIYGIVAEKVHAECCTLAEGEGWPAFYAKAALQIGITRKVTKRSVMILPYGGTTSACREYLTEFYEDYFKEQRKEDPDYTLPFGEYTLIGTKPDGTKLREGGLDNFIVFFSRIVWKYIEKTVIAARVAMKWLQKQARRVAKGPYTVEEVDGKKKKVYGPGNPIVWTVGATGFRVVQKVKQFSVQRVETALFGRTTINMAVSTDEIHVGRMASSIAPNFIHSMDAAHQDLTVNAALDEGMDSFWNVHDSFMVPFGQSARFAEIIREQFYALHTEHRVLEEWRDEQLATHGWLELDETPEDGDLDPEEVLTAKFLFG